MSKLSSVICYDEGQSHRAMKCQILVFSILGCLLSSTAWAYIRLPAIISDNMVLQANANDSIWGWADPNEKVTVKIGSQILGTTAGAQGKWHLILNPLEASSEPVVMTIAGKNTIIIHNILIGQVWLGSGQSNMTMPVAISKAKASPGVIDANTEIKNADYPQIRLFTVTQNVSHKPLDDCNGSWTICSPETVKDFSATLYFFGRDIYKNLNQPVGLIHTSYGGSPVEAWISEPVLKGEPVAAAIIERWRNALIYPEKMEKYKRDIDIWEHDFNEAKNKGALLPEKPKAPVKGPDHHQPSVLFNAMLSPLIPFHIKGVIWYQGESNADRAWQYRRLFPLMVADWRKRWQEGDFSFYFVQITRFKATPRWPEPQWAELRQAQLETLNIIPNTGMAVTIDIGETDEIHPKNKQEVGRRLALIALAKTYGKNIEYSGPIYKNYAVDANSVTIFFDNISGGLVSKDGALNQFTIAGADQKFYPAHAVIMDKDDKGKVNDDRKTGYQAVRVSSPDVNAPAAVRYAWSSNPEGANLYNAAGLPASPFKTDDWPWTTEKAE
jgi:hypothetical protein